MSEPIPMKRWYAPQTKKKRLTNKKETIGQRLRAEAIKFKEALGIEARKNEKPAIRGNYTISTVLNTESY